MLYYGTRRIFYWIYSLFENYIIPKPPVEPTWKVWKWGAGSLDTRPINPNIFASGSMDRYTVPNSPSNWTKIPSTIYDGLRYTSDPSSWIPNWVWYTGVLILTLGIGFIGYSIYSDPAIITNHLPFRSNAAVNNPPAIQVNDTSTNRNPLSFFI